MDYFLINKYRSPIKSLSLDLVNKPNALPINTKDQMYREIFSKRWNLFRAPSNIYSFY